MSNREDRPEKRHRAITVDMSSEAITSRLREVGELHQLGMSLARAKPVAPQPSSATGDSVPPSVVQCGPPGSGGA